MVVVLFLAACTAPGEGAQVGRPDAPPTQPETTLPEPILPEPTPPEPTGPATWVATTIYTGPPGFYARNASVATDGTGIYALWQISNVMPDATQEWVQHLYLADLGRGTPLREIGGPLAPETAYQPQIATSPGAGTVTVVAKVDCDERWSACREGKPEFEAIRLEAASLDELGRQPVDLVHVGEEKGRGFTAYKGTNIVGTCYKSKSDELRDELWCAEQRDGAPFDPPELVWSTPGTEDHAGLLYRPDGTRAVALVADPFDTLRQTAIIADATVPGDAPAILSSPEALGLDPYLAEGTDGVLHVVFGESLDAAPRTLRHAECASGCDTSAGWTVTTISADSDADEPSIGVSGNVPVVTYTLAGLVHVAWRCAGVWVDEAIDSGGGDQTTMRGLPSLSVAPDGAVHVVYTTDFTDTSDVRWAWRRGDLCGG